MQKLESVIYIKDKLFWGSLSHKNRQFLMLLSVICFVLECFMLFLYYFNDSLGLPIIPSYYIYIYVPAIICSAAYFGISTVFRNNEVVFQRSQNLFLAFLLLWGAFFAALDVYTGRSSYIFAVIMIFCCEGVRTNSVYHCVLNLSSFLVYTICLAIMPVDRTTMWAEILNSFLLFLMACAIVIYNNHNKYKAYLNELTIQKQHQSLLYYANHDQLTSALIKDRIRSILEQMLKADHNNVICIMVDIDNFKVYNDTKGHLEGDQCLKRVAKILINATAQFGGYLGRFGGEEFLIVLTDLTESRLQGFADKIITDIENEKLSFPLNDQEAIVTISAGIHVIRERTGMDSETAIRSADRALYQAKRNGKNRFEIVYT